MRFKNVLFVMVHLYDTKMVTSAAQATWRTTSGRYPQSISVGLIMRIVRTLPGKQSSSNGEDARIVSYVEYVG